jgi:hypothetical protein
MVLRMTALLFGLAMSLSCTPAPPISGYVTRPPETSILFVYPKVLQVGDAIVVQTRLPRTEGATQCLSLVGPDGLEAELSCGVVESRRVVMRPTQAGRNVVRLDLMIGDRLGARREEPICVVGAPEAAECEGD